MWYPSQENEEPKTISDWGLSVEELSKWNISSQSKAQCWFWALESEKLNWKLSKRPKSVFPQCWSRTARLFFAYQTKTAWVLPMVMVLTWKSSILFRCTCGNDSLHACRGRYFEMFDVLGGHFGVFDSQPHFRSYFSSFLSVLALGPTVILRVYSCLDLGPETGRLHHL